MDRYRVKPDQKITLDVWDANETGDFEGGKTAGKAHLRYLNAELETLQELLYAEGKYRILIVLQGMDTSGKDGTIRHVFEGVNPQGVRVAGFKKPTSEELAHDFLWRVHKRVPRNGEIVIFNRSHYEDVLVVRVHELVPPEVWRKRYDQIVAFERILAETGTVILKFYLHIDKDEQKERLQARLDNFDKRWKFNPDDLKERALWDDYIQCYEDVLDKTSTEYAPWYIVPANRKWYRNLVVASVIIERLKELKMEYPQQRADLEGIVIE
jgi:PPK2 family polyphosphate:nucleotide phosphotransferase